MGRVITTCSQGRVEQIQNAQRLGALVQKMSVLSYCKPCSNELNIEKGSGRHPIVNAQYGEVLHTLRCTHTACLGRVNGELHCLQ